MTQPMKPNGPSAESLLVTALREWSLLYGKAIKDEAIEVWMRVFKSYPVAALSVALEKVTENAERMPTPGGLKRELEKVIEAQPWVMPQRGERNCRCTKCDGTGFQIVTNAKAAPGSGYQVAIKCDCHQEHATVRGSLEHVDADGTPCEIDARTGDLLYRAEDCPEGRAFLAKFARLAGKVDLAEWYRDDMIGPRPVAKLGVVVEKLKPKPNAWCERCGKEFWSDPATAAREFMAHDCLDAPGGDAA